TAVPEGRTNRLDAHRSRRRFAARSVETFERVETIRSRARPARGAANPLQCRSQRARAADRLDERLHRVLARKIRCAGRPAQQDGPMNKTETKSVVLERELAHSPEKIWRALTQPHLIAEWLMQNDFKLAMGHRFNLRTQAY